MEIRKRSILAVIVLTATLLVSACNAASTPVPQSEAEAAVCAALQTWSDEMRTFTDLDVSTASIEDAQAQRDVVAAAWDEVKAALEGVESADKAAVEAGGEALTQALQDFPTDVPLADALAGVKTAAEPLKAAYVEMGDGMGCVFVTPY